MHWEKLPKVVHDEEAVREYEQEESRQIAKSLKRAAWIVLPVALVIIWLLLR
jgi:predicted RND superfamily exporter protein